MPKIEILKSTIRIYDFSLGLKLRVKYRFCGSQKIIPEYLENKNTFKFLFQMGAGKDGSNKTAIIAAIGSLLVDLIAFTIILPLLPSIIQNYKKTDTSGLYAYFSDRAESLGKLIGAPGDQSEAVLIGGMLGSLFCLLQFISAPILGAFSDSFGRRSALLICLVRYLSNFKELRF